MRLAGTSQMAPWHGLKAEGSSFPILAVIGSRFFMVCVRNVWEDGLALLLHLVLIGSSIFQVLLGT